MTTVASTARPPSRNLPARRHNNRIGNSRNAGYSFAAAPSPSITPASTGRFRAQASRPTAANAVAIASKLVNACTITSGEAAINTASHGRRRAVLVTAQTVISQSRPRNNALKSK